MPLIVLGLDRVFARITEAGSVTAAIIDIIYETLLFCLYSSNRSPLAKTVCILVLTLSEEVHLNPGLDLEEVYPCRYSQRNVNWG